jgi:hypothetical protein
VALCRQETPWHGISRTGKAPAGKLSKAISLDTNLSAAHATLGNCLAEKGDPKGAIAHYHKAIALDPSRFTPHAALGYVLLAQGDFAKALVATADAVDRMPAGHPQRALLLDQLRTCEIYLNLNSVLESALQSKVTVASAPTAVKLAQLCQQPYRQLHAASARFYAEAFAADDKLANDLQAQNRYNAACSAALAGCGRGKDAMGLDGAERARLRGNALRWLRADLTSVGNWLLEDGTGKTRPVVVQRLEHWLKDPDFADVRGDTLAKLPEMEREPWRNLWTEVEKTLAAARKQTTKQRKDEKKN